MTTRDEFIAETEQLFAKTLRDRGLSAADAQTAAEYFIEYLMVVEKQMPMLAKLFA